MTLDVKKCRINTTTFFYIDVSKKLNIGQVQNGCISTYIFQSVETSDSIVTYESATMSAVMRLALDDLPGISLFCYYTELENFADSHSHITLQEDKSMHASVYNLCAVIISMRFCVFCQV